MYFSYYYLYEITSPLKLIRKSKLLSWFYFPVDTGPKLNVHKTFRRRPGRLLSVLCTFNLCPASMRLGLLSLTPEVTAMAYFIVKMAILG